MRRLPLLFLVTFPMAACEPRSRDVVIHHDLGPQAKAEASLEGHPLGDVSGAEFTLRAVPTWTSTPHSKNSCALPPCRGDDSPSLLLRTQNACGPVEYCVRFPQDGNGAPMPGRSQPLVGTLSGRKRAAYDLCTRDEMLMWVDNRGGSAHTISVGTSFRRAVPAGVTTSIDVPVADCDAEAQVAIDGTPVGSVPVIPPSTGWEQHLGFRERTLVVDPSGEHCYESSTVSYSPNGSGDAGPAKRALHGARAYALDARVTDFLAKVPDSIKSPGGYGSRTDLLDAACEPGSLEVGYAAPASTPALPPAYFSAPLPALRDFDRWNALTSDPGGKRPSGPPRPFVVARLREGNPEMHARLQTAMRAAAGAGASGQALAGTYGSLLTLQEPGDAECRIYLATLDGDAPSAVKSVYWRALLGCRGAAVDAAYQRADVPDIVRVHRMGRREPLDRRLELAARVLQDAGRKLPASASFSETSLRETDLEDAARLVGEDDDPRVAALMVKAWEASRGDENLQSSLATAMDHQSDPRAHAIYVKNCTLVRPASECTVVAERESERRMDATIDATRVDARASEREARGLGMTYVSLMPSAPTAWGQGYDDDLARLAELAGPALQDVVFEEKPSSRTASSVFAWMDGKRYQLAVPTPKILDLRAMIGLLNVLCRERGRSERFAVVTATGATIDARLNPAVVVGSEQELRAAAAKGAHYDDGEAAMRLALQAEAEVEREADALTKSSR